MKFINRNAKYVAVALVTLLVGVAAAGTFGQDKNKIKDKVGRIDTKGREFCSNNNWSSDDKVSASQLREMTVSAGGTLTVDGRQNGGIQVRGEDRSDILVRACVQAWGTSEDAAKALGERVAISTGGTIRADGPTDNGNGWNNNGWSVSYQILTPRNTNLNLTARNG